MIDPLPRLVHGRLTNDGVLGRYTGAGVRIAVADSGVAIGHPHIRRIGGGVALVGADPNDIADRVGHGTAVVAAIQDVAPDAELFVVRIVDTYMSTSARRLTLAIEWAITNGIHIVNVSFGTVNDAHMELFRDALAFAAKHEVLVVSAAGEGETIWFPGILPGAVGVYGDRATPRHGITLVTETLGKGVAASPYPRPIGLFSETYNMSGVSFAVANATGMIARALEAGAPRSTPKVLYRWLVARVDGAPRGAAGDAAPHGV